MRIKKEWLAHKGWHPQDIERVMKGFNTAQSKKSNLHKFIEAFTPWLALSIAIIGNFIVSFALIPFIILIGDLNIYFLTVIIAASFGVLFSAVIKDIDMQIHHDIIVLLIVPTIGFLNFFIITRIANSLALSYQLMTHHQPSLLSLTYIIAFLAPYANFLIHKWYTTRQITAGKAYGS